MLIGHGCGTRIGGPIDPAPISTPWRGTVDTGGSARVVSARVVGVVTGASDGRSGTAAVVGVAAGVVGGAAGPAIELGAADAVAAASGCVVPDRSGDEQAAASRVETTVAVAMGVVRRRAVSLTSIITSTLPMSARFHAASGGSLADPHGRLLDTLPGVATDRRSARITSAVVAGALVWLLLLSVVWAAQPLNDTVIVGVDEDGRRVTADIECNTLFDGEPVDPARLAVIEAIGPAIADQEPCQSVHSQARLLAVLNVLLAIAVIAGALAVAARSRRHDDDSAAPDHITASAAPG